MDKRWRQDVGDELSSKQQEAFREQRQRQELFSDLNKKAFKFFDDEGSSKISLKNLKRVAKEIGENLPDEYWKELLEDADRDGDGEIDEEEFNRVMKKVE